MSTARARRTIEYRVTHGGTLGASWYTVARRVDSASVDAWVPVPARGGKSTENPPRINPARFRFPDRTMALLTVRRQIAADLAAAKRLDMGATVTEHPRDHALVATVDIFF